MPRVAGLRKVSGTLAILTVMFQAGHLLGQFGTGTILGTITDPTNAIVPNVTVEAKNTATNETRTFTTDEAGNFRFSALPSGTYTVSASGSGFRTATAQDIVLRVNTQVRVDIVMQLGTVSESVEVLATTPQLQTDTAALGTVIDNRTTVSYTHLTLPTILRV